MGSIWGRQDQGGPHAGPVNFAVWVMLQWIPDVFLIYIVWICSAAFANFSLSTGHQWQSTCPGQVKLECLQAGQHSMVLVQWARWKLELTFLIKNMHCKHVYLRDPAEITCQLSAYHNYTCYNTSVWQLIDITYINKYKDFDFSCLLFSRQVTLCDGLVYLHIHLSLQTDNLKS